jgi:flagellar biosynthesis protein FliR
MDANLISLKDIIRFSMVLTRVAGIMTFAPIFNSRSIPMQSKAVLCLVVSFAMFPVVPASQIPAEINAGTFLTMTLVQIFYGFVIGLAASFLFAGMQLAGQLISFGMGFSIINLIDPQSDVEVSVFSLFQNYIGLLFFFMINGHHWFFMAISESFNYLPVAGLAIKGPLVDEIIHLSANILVAGIQIAGPILAVTLILDMVLGIIGRAAPQIQILIVGMPLKILVGFGCLSVSFYYLPHLLGKSFEKLFLDLIAISRSMS